MNQVLCEVSSAKGASQVSTAVVQIVVFLKGNVAAPVADLDIAVQLLDVGHRLLKLETNTRGGDSTGGLLFKRSIDKLGALLDGVLLDVAASRKLCVIGNVGGTSLDFGLLLLRGVGGWCVNGEVVGKELPSPLRNDCRGRGIGLEVVVGDTERLLSTRLEWRR